MTEAEPITIDVTQEHIDMGLPMAPDYCPVALAMLGAGLDAPTVNVDRIHWEGVDDMGHLLYTRARVPADVAHFVNKFDAGIKQLRPFTFTLTPMGDQT